MILRRPSLTVYITAISLPSTIPMATHRVSTWCRDSVSKTGPSKIRIASLKSIRRSSKALCRWPSGRQKKDIADVGAGVKDFFIAFKNARSYS